MQHQLAQNIRINLQMVTQQMIRKFKMFKTQEIQLLMKQDLSINIEQNGVIPKIIQALTIQLKKEATNGKTMKEFNSAQNWTLVKLMMISIMLVDTANLHKSMIWKLPHTLNSAKS